MEKLILIGYPESTLEPKKIVIEDVKGDIVAQIYIDGEVSIHGRYTYPAMLKQFIMIAENFMLFYDNVENGNPKE
jgi:hypothetical protein